MFFQRFIVRLLWNNYKLKLINYKLTIYKQWLLQNVAIKSSWDFLWNHSESLRWTYLFRNSFIVVAELMYMCFFYKHRPQISCSRFSTVPVTSFTSVWEATVPFSSVSVVNADGTESLIRFLRLLPQKSQTCDSRLAWITRRTRSTSQCLSCCRWFILIKLSVK